MADTPRPNDERPMLAGEWDAAQDSADAMKEAPRVGGMRGRAWVRRYGGHPVAVRLGARTYSRRLFVGGRERTMKLPLLTRPRPAVDVIVNLCDLPDHEAITTPSDCWWPRGEGPLGFRPDTLLRDALAVADLLRHGRTVLIHCAAGVNRAPTLCAAVLMVMEGCTARAALRRVRRYRWMAMPDPWHWRTLRLLEARLAANAATDGESARSA